MADDPNPRSPVPDSASSPGSRPPARQAVLDDVYARAAAIRRRRSAWLGVGGGLAVVVVIASLVAVIPDRGNGSVLTADLADSVGSTATASTRPSTTGTVFSTATTGSTTKQPGTTNLSPPPETNPAPDDDDVVATLPPDTGTETTATTSPSSQPDRDGVRIMLVEPEQPRTGEDVTLLVRVVDQDTDLHLCSVDWFHGSGAPTTSAPSPGCPNKTCGPNDPDPNAEPGKTDRVDTLAPHTYSSSGTYVAQVVYEGGQCTPYADRYTDQVTIVVR